MNATQNTSQTQSHRTFRATTFSIITAAALVVGFGTLPAAARQDPRTGFPEQQTTATYFCAIQRVDTQFVGCDNLTGNGVPAPAWVDER